MTDFLKSLDNILFLDIETASQFEKFDDVPPRLAEEWLKKEKLLFKDEQKENNGEKYFERSGIFAEFGKVISIGVGFMVWDPQTEHITLRCKAFADASEKFLLEDFKTLLEKKSRHVCILETRPLGLQKLTHF